MHNTLEYLHLMEIFVKNAYLIGVLLPLALGVAPAVMAATASAKDSAEPAGETFGNPPVLNTSTAPRAGSLLLRQPQAAPRPHSGQLRNYDLFVTFTDGFIRNPAQGRPDPVRLRSYRGTDVDPSHPFVAPTIEATPGDTVRIKLQNQLPADPDCNNQAQADINNPHCFNGTNLHSHGVWVSPSGNSDNVLVSINPGVSFEYEYNIPADHPAGTFWYHPHRHGSTALQVGSGMAGALIIRGDRPPTRDANGDLDTLLKSPKGAAMTERVLLFEQIPYACTKDGKLKTKSDGSIDWSCAPGEVGEIVCRGDVVMAGYWNNAGATAEALRDGWLYTGDMGSFDRRGYLTLRDRSKDVIISGGTNIYPREVEEVLLRHADVAEVCVTGQPDPEWGEIVVAFIVAEPGREISPDSLDAHCNASIARFKRPKRYLFVEGLPKNNYGKVVKRELRARLSGGA